jgi:protein disulfide-isomerase A6
VDATVESKLGKRFGDRGFLSIKLFRKGQEVEDYKGGRTKGDIVKYIRQEAGQVKDEL